MGKCLINPYPEGPIAESTHLAAKSNKWKPVSKCFEIAHFYIHTNRPTMNASLGMLVSFIHILLYASARFNLAKKDWDQPVFVVDNVLREVLECIAKLYSFCRVNGIDRGV
eukprot:1434356-Ditylum_brightwellii.AAC.1